MILKALAALCTALAAAAALASATATANEAELAARPNPSAPMKFDVGKTRLNHGAILYRPANPSGGPYPLVVLAHGYTQPPGKLLDWLKPAADGEGILLLAIRSRSERWDLVPDPRRRISARFRHSFDFGPDVERIDEVLEELFAGAPIDPKRVALLGFSDGASSALSLGLVNYELFPSIVAFAPGFARIPPRVAPAQRILIASGTGDRVLPHEVVTEKIVPLLVASRLRPVFCTFDSGHVMPPALLRNALAYVVGNGSTAPAPTAGERPFECVAR